MVDNPPPGVEGALYERIRRSRPAPQGICSMNSAGNVLAWALSFEDSGQIPKFLDHVESRYAEAPNERDGVVAERFRKFPGGKIGPDHRELEPPPAIPTSHSAEVPCPAAISMPAGGLSGTVVGRVLDENGEPVTETIRQENYLEARVEVPPGAVSGFLDLAGSKQEFPVPDSFTWAVVGPAYLGQLDVNPSGAVPGSRNLSNRADLRAVRVPDESGTSLAARFRIRGTSDIRGLQTPAAGRTDGRDWEHRVTLEWDGFAEIDPQSRRMIKLVMLANGTERLRWGNEDLLATREPAAAHLMAGHAIDFDGAVRYGLIVEARNGTIDPEIESAPEPAGLDRMRRVRSKLKSVRRRVQQRARSGELPVEIDRRMGELRLLIERRNWAEADALLDDLLESPERD